jgi:hypothetical protein
MTWQRIIDADAHMFEPPTLRTHALPLSSSGSAWPSSREALARDFGAIPEPDRCKIVCENAASLCGFEG